MKFYLIDDDENVTDILTLIIEQRGLGEVCGVSTNGLDALDDLAFHLPDIVIVDLLMPLVDGVAFVKSAKARYPGLSFIMLSQVSSKEMIAGAYESGVEFFIQKPVNALEVERVISQVAEKLSMRRAFHQMQSLFEKMSPAAPAPAPAPAASASEPEKPPRRALLDQILLRLGIAGEVGSRDIAALLGCLWDEGKTPDEITLGQLCAKISENPKSVEQRVRRAALAGMVNLANLGIEDYANDVFTEFAGTLYNFEQVKKEMDCIRGRSDEHGKVYVKNFLTALWSYCQHRRA